MQLQCSVARRGVAYRIKKYIKCGDVAMREGYAQHSRAATGGPNAGDRGRPRANADHHYCVQRVRIGVCVVFVPRSNGVREEGVVALFRAWGPQSIFGGRAARSLCVPRGSKITSKDWLVRLSLGTWRWRTFVAVANCCALTGGGEPQKICYFGRFSVSISSFTRLQNKRRALCFRRWRK